MHITDPRKKIFLFIANHHKSLNISWKTIARALKCISYHKLALRVQRQYCYWKPSIISTANELLLACYAWRLYKDCLMNGAVIVVYLATETIKLLFVIVGHLQCNPQRDYSTSDQEQPFPRYFNFPNLGSSTTLRGKALFN